MTDETNLETGPGLETYTPPAFVKVGNFKQHPAYQPAGSHLDNVRQHLTPGTITSRIIDCHRAAWEAGWWHNLRTGKPLDRNAGEMMLLQCSELGEAADGAAGDLMDDKLPHRRALEVEIADFLIRLYDYCGGLRLDLELACQRSVATESMFGVVLPEPNVPILWMACRHIFKAMEAHRKNRMDEHVACLARAHRAVVHLAEVSRLDIEGARVEKMAFNRKRPDHQRDARLAPDGKAY